MPKSRTTLQQKYDGEIVNIFTIAEGLISFKQHNLNVETLVQLLIDDAIDMGEHEDAAGYALTAARLIDAYKLDIHPPGYVADAVEAHLETPRCRRPADMAAIARVWIKNPTTRGQHVGMKRLHAQRAKSDHHVEFYHPDAEDIVLERLKRRFGTLQVLRQRPDCRRYARAELRA
jgi:hypothetical protein